MYKGHWPRLTPSIFSLQRVLTLVMDLPGLKHLLFLAFIYKFPFGLAAVHSVSHNDPAIAYLPRVCDLDCTRVCQGEWWLSCLSDGSASHRTKGNATEASLVFRGGSVSWFTRIAPNGGKAVVWIDGIESQHIDTYSPVTVESQNIYTKSGLDPSRDHRISVLFDTASFVSDRSQERFVDIHHFEYDDSGSSSGSGSGSSASTALIPSGSQSTLPLVSGSQRSTISGQTISPLSGGSQATTNTGALQSLHVSLGSQTGSVLASGGADLANVASTGGNQNQKLSPGAIIGVVFGALVLLLVTAIFLWFVRQKRRQNGAEFKHQEIPEMDEDKNLRTYQREPGMELQARSPVRSPARSTRSAESPHQSISRYPPLGPDHPHQTTSTLDLAVSPRETLPLPVHLSPWSPLYQHPFGQREEEQETEAEPYAESELETASRPGGGATGTSTPYAFEGAGSRKWQMMMNGSRSALNVNTNNANPTRLSPPRTPNTEYSGSGTRMSTMADRPSPMVDDFASSQSGRLVRRESLGFDSSVRGETPPPSYVQ